MKLDNALDRFEEIEAEAAPRGESFAWATWMVAHLHGIDSDDAPTIPDPGCCDECGVKCEARFAYRALVLCHTCLTRRQRVAQVAA